MRTRERLDWRFRGRGMEFPRLEDGGRARAGAYPDPAAGAVDREPDWHSLTSTWESMGFVWCPENLCHCWRDSCPCQEVCE